MNKFAMIGVAGYIAPRHLAAIKDTNGVLLAALDKADSVGVLDRYFPETHFFTEFERFDRHIDKLKRKDSKIDYVTICTPNYLHDAHIRFALRSGAHAICEKPLVLNPWNLDALAMIEQETGKKVNCILQLRLHPQILALKSKIDAAALTAGVYNVDLTYITARGSWYNNSWKGDVEKSGGILTNIGIHFFDMLTWLFGGVTATQVHAQSPDYAAGTLQLEKANVRWFLSVNASHLPKECLEQNVRTFRSVTVDGEEIEFSDGFDNLHTKSYSEITKGKGFGLSDAATSVNTVYVLKQLAPAATVGDYHPVLKKINK